MKHARSGIASENLQEVLDASTNGLEGGQQQYVTPEWLADQCAARLPKTTPTTIIDPQCGEGALVNVGTWGTDRYGIDIDNRLKTIGCKLVTGNCVKVAEAMDDLYPDLRFECANANPPFGRKFKLANGSVMDSTEWTWRFVTGRANYGYFISNHSTLEKLGIKDHPWVFYYEVKDGLSLWKGVRDTLKIGIAFWKRPIAALDPNPTDAWKINIAWGHLQNIVDEEKLSRPPHNIYLDARGYLKTYLSHRSEVKFKLTKEQITQLNRINGTHPLTLTTEKETRDLLGHLIGCGIYTFQPEAKAAIESALTEVNALACPIMPVTQFESVAYADEEEALECQLAVSNEKYCFTTGRKYPITTGTYKFVQTFKRKKPHFDEKSGVTFTKEHECQLSGQDRYIQVTDDAGNAKRFMDRPKVEGLDFDESDLWRLFKQPVVKTIAESSPEMIERNTAVLDSAEMLAGFEYYQGQREYLARVASKRSGLVAAATGTGKTLMAISLLAMKSPERALIIAPQGTMRSSEGSGDEDDDAEEYAASQWIQEINRFAPEMQIWEIFSYGDYERICSLNKGKLPPGVYVTYPQAMFLNEGARESAPKDWDDAKLAKFLKEKFHIELPEAPEGELGKRYWCDSIGEEQNGIRSILTPCLATKIGHLFDMVLVDEAHLATNLGANITQMLIRLQPAYRWALTATPIPNIVSNLFSLMGWIAVPDWYKGERRNAAFPYARGEIGKFDGTFLSVERDFTQEDDNRRADPLWRGVCSKPSPVISAPARLLKLLKPSMAYIGKEQCNPAYIPPQVIDVRVPLGKEQAALYGYFLDRGHIPAKHPLIRARKQVAWLRGICADPAGFTHGGPAVSSNLNPKVIAILELTRDILARNEQVVIINSRVGLSDTIQHRLAEAGVPMARIDSTMPPEQHARQANLFKQRKAAAMIMGIKCAASHSFDQCVNEIIGSVEYSPGPFVQAQGRIDRVTNKVVKKIYCILHRDTIEEVMFDVVATKDDAATICLKGRRIPREFRPVDGGEILATAMERFKEACSKPERDCEIEWPKLRDTIREASFDFST